MRIIIIKNYETFQDDDAKVVNQRRLNELSYSKSAKQSFQ